MNYSVSRKLVVMFLCFCIVISAGFTGGVYAEAASGQAAASPLVNPDFEQPMQDGVVPAWSQRHLANGSFELPVTGGAIPGWKVVSGNASVSNEQAVSGSSSLYIENEAGSGSGINMESDLIDVDEGAVYSLSANAWLEQGALQGIYVYVYDEAGKLVQGAEGSDFHAYLDLTSPSGEWVYKDKPFIVQPGGKGLKVSLISSNRRAYQYYLDDIAVTKSVNNGDYEQEVVEGEIPGWKKTAEQDGNTYSITTEKFASGAQSLLVENDPGKFMNVISDLIEVEPGTEYTALAETFIEYGSSDMYVRFFDGGGRYVGKQAWSIKSEPSGTWFTNAVPVTVPDEAVYAAILFAGSPTKSFKYYVDDVKLLRGVHTVGDAVPDNSITKVGQNLGVQIRKATIMRGDYGKDGEGRDVLYTVVAGAPSIFTIIDIKTEKVVKSLPMPNTSGAWSVKVSNDGSVYLGAYNLGLLYRYLPETGELLNLGHPLPTKDSVLYPMDSGKNGKMYGSTYPTAHLYEYDPVANQFTDYGTLSHQSSGERWTRVVVYDSENHKVYAGVGNQARLVEVDLATGNKRDLLPPEYSNITSVYDLNLVEGKLFARKEANNANEMFVIDVKTGEQVEITNADTGEKSFLIPNFSRGISPKSPVEDKIYYAGAQGMLYSYDLTNDKIQSLGVSVGGAAIAYGFAELGEEGFPGYSLVGLSGNEGQMFKYNLETGSVKLTNVMLPAEPVNLHDIEKGPDGKIYTAGYLQGNLGIHTPSTGESTYLSGIGQIEGMTSIGSSLFVGVYPDARIYEYDLTKPWNRTDSDHLNPDLLFSLKDNTDIPGYTLQDRPFGMAGAEDLNKLFVGTVPKNGMLGGALAVYDLQTREEPEVYWNVVPDQSILSLAYKDGLLYGGTSIHGGQGGAPAAKEAVLFVWDAVKGEKVFEIVPVADKQAITALHIGPDGNIWGLANGALFVFDPIERQVIFSKDEFPSASGRWIDGSMETGTDGHIYATVGGMFFKVDAVTKAVTVLASRAKKVAQDDFGHFYLYTEPGGPFLYKYTDPSLIVQLTGAELEVPRTTLTVGETVPLAVKGILERGRSTYDLDGAVITYTVTPSDAAAITGNRLEAKRTGTVQITAEVTLNGVTVQSGQIELLINPEPASGIPAVLEQVNRYGQSGEVKEPLLGKLIKELEKAWDDQAKGDMKKRNNHLRVALVQLENKNPKFISDEAREVLIVQISALME